MLYCENELLHHDHAGSDFIDLQWVDSSYDPQCIAGVATFCRRTDEAAQQWSPANCSLARTEAGHTRGAAGGLARSGRVNHLTPCTRYQCWAAYPDEEVSCGCSTGRVNLSTIPDRE